MDAGESFSGFCKTTTSFSEYHCSGDECVKRDRYCPSGKQCIPMSGSTFACATDFECTDTTEGVTAVFYGVDDVTEKGSELIALADKASLDGTTLTLEVQDICEGTLTKKYRCVDPSTGIKGVTYSISSCPGGTSCSEGKCV